LTASVSATPVVLPAVGTQKDVKKAYNQLTKEEKKKVRQLLKKEIKAILKNSKKNANTVTTQISGDMDHDLKLAAIFGAVGLVGLLIGGNFFGVIGAVAMIIGLVFFVKWLMRQ
jgi:preprotein translocase subunit SecF